MLPNHLEFPRQYHRGHENHPIHHFLVHCSWDFSPKDANVIPQVLMLVHSWICQMEISRTFQKTRKCLKLMHTDVVLTKHVTQSKGWCEQLYQVHPWVARTTPSHRLLLQCLTKTRHIKRSQFRRQPYNTVTLPTSVPESHFPDSLQLIFMIWPSGSTVWPWSHGASQFWT